MNKVPDIISTKDLSYISDAFEWNFTAAKKCIAYSNLVTDDKIAKALEKSYLLHKYTCEQLLKIIGGE